MRRLTLLRRPVLARIGVIRGLHLRRIHFNARRQRIRRQHHVFDLRLFGCLERLRVLLVVRLDLRVIDLH